MKGAALLAGAVALLGCESVPRFTVTPETIDRQSWETARLTLHGVSARLVVRRRGELVLRDDVQYALGSTPLDVERIDADEVVLRLLSGPELGQFPVTVASPVADWASLNQVRVVAGPATVGGWATDRQIWTADGLAVSASDAGAVVPPAIDEAWEWEPPVEVAGVGATSGCSINPALTPDLRWLLMTAGGDDIGCPFDRTQSVYEWNDGVPLDQDVRVSFAGIRSISGQPLPGDVIGSPDDWAVLFSRFGFGALYAGVLPQPSLVEPSAAALPLAGDPRGLDPSASLDGRSIMLDSGGSLVELVDAFTASTLFEVPHPELDASGHDSALSADGMVIIYAADGPAGDDDLWIGTRAAIGEPFVGLARLSSGPDAINSDADEADAFLASNGDLLFTSDRGGGKRRLFLARRILP